MKALSLTQPWATLVANGSKRFETRSWRTNHRGVLAVHAAKGLAGFKDEDEWVALLYEEPFWPAIFGDESAAGRDPCELLPRGAVVAVAILTVCHRVEDVRDSLGSPAERAFGNYEDGRWAWRFDDVVALPKPVECRGLPGVWDVPPGVLEHVNFEYVRGLDLAAGGAACRECGCTENTACADGCYWVEPDLCSSCAGVDAGLEVIV